MNGCQLNRASSCEPIYHPQEILENDLIPETFAVVSQDTDQNFLQPSTSGSVQSHSVYTSTSGSVQSHSPHTSTSGSVQTVTPYDPNFQAMVENGKNRPVISHKLCQSTANTPDDNQLPQQDSNMQCPQLTNSISNDEKTLFILSDMQKKINEGQIMSYHLRQEMFSEISSAGNSPSVVDTSPELNSSKNVVDKIFNTLQSDGVNPTAVHAPQKKNKNLKRKRPASSTNEDVPPVKNVCSSLRQQDETQDIKPKIYYQQVLVQNEVIDLTNVPNSPLPPPKKPQLDTLVSLNKNERGRY